MKAFIVEDEKVVRDGIKIGINWKKLGWELTGDASDGESALPIILSRKPDVLLTNVRLPVMDGPDLALRVKEKLPRTKVIFFGIQEDLDYAKKVVRLKPEDYLMTPISRKMLVKALETFSDASLWNQASSEEEGVPQGSGDTPDFDRATDPDPMMRFLQKGDAKDLDAFVKDYVYKTGELASSQEFREFMLDKLYHLAEEYLGEWGLEPSQTAAKLGKQEDGKAAAQEVKKTRRYMKDILYKCLKVRHDCTYNKYADYMARGKAYIQEHFREQDFSLNTVANYLGVSAGHFSGIFRQEEGRNFIDYLSEVRIQEAKNLLKNTDKKIYQIAVEIGYKDSHYFSHYFRLSQGVTPREFRRAANQRKMEEAG